MTCLAEETFTIGTAFVTGGGSTPHVALLMGKTALIIQNHLIYLVAETADYPIDDMRRTSPITTKTVFDTENRRIIALIEALNELHQIAPARATFSFQDEFAHADAIGLNATMVMEQLHLWGNKNKRRMRMYRHFGTYVYKNQT